MIEVLFDESEAGSMKVAKNMVIPGEVDEVVCLGFVVFTICAVSCRMSKMRFML